MRIGEVTLQATRPKIEHGLTKIQQNLLKYQNPSLLVAEYSTSNIQIREKRGLEEVAGSNTIPTLADLARAYNTNVYATTLIINHLSWLTSCTDSDLIKDQFKELSLLIASEYYYINLVEWNIFFKRCMLGDYNQIVWGDKINVQQLMIAIKSFTVDRINAIASKQRKLNSKYSIPLRTQGVNIVKGIDSVRELNKLAKTNYAAFRQLFPNLPSDRSELVYWRAWRIYERSVGQFLCEYNLKDRNAAV